MSMDIYQKLLEVLVFHRNEGIPLKVPLNSVNVVPPNLFLDLNKRSFNISDSDINNAETYTNHLIAAGAPEPEIQYSLYYQTRLKQQVVLCTSRPLEMDLQADAICMLLKLALERNSELLALQKRVTELETEIAPLKIEVLNSRIRMHNILLGGGINGNEYHVLYNEKGQLPIDVGLVNITSVKEIDEMDPKQLDKYLEFNRYPIPTLLNVLH